MKKKTLIIIGVIVVAVIVFLALKPFSKKESGVTFDTVKVERGDITNSVTATGTIEAITTVEVGTQVSGIIERIYVDFNDNVKQGQVLARLDETSLKAQVEQSQASVDQSLAQLNYQEATYKRLKALFEKNLIAQADYDQALFNYENSKAALSNAKSSLVRAKVNLNYATITSPIDGVVLNRAVEEGQTVAASFNTPEMFTIVNDLTQMEVQTSVDEADIGRVMQNQRVEFTVDAYPEMKFNGSVSQVRLQPVTTNNVVTYVVILSAPNPDNKLMPGMTASATIYVEEKTDALILSGKALRFTPDTRYLKKMMAERMKNSSMAGSSGNSSAASPSDAQSLGMSSGTGTQDAGKLPGAGQMPEGMKRVWVKNDNGGLRPVPVKIGMDNGTNVEILTGLKEGDEVIISMSGGTTEKAGSTRDNEGQKGPFPGFGPQGG